MICVQIIENWLLYNYQNFWGKKKLTVNAKQILILYMLIFNYVIFLRQKPWVVLTPLPRSLHTCWGKEDGVVSCRGSRNCPLCFPGARVALLVSSRILANWQLFCIHELGVFYDLGMMGTWVLWFPPVSGVSEVSEPKEPLWKSGVKGWWSRREITIT